MIVSSGWQVIEAKDINYITPKLGIEGNFLVSGYRVRKTIISSMFCFFIRNQI